MSTFRDLIQWNRIENRIPEVASTLTPSNIATVQTSVNHDNVKTVECNHSSLLNIGQLIGQELGLNRMDRLCSLLPLNTIDGQAIGIWASIAHGSVFVMASKFFNPEHTLKTLTDESCTILVALPQQLEDLLKYPNLAKYPTKTLRTILIVNSPETNFYPEMIQQLKTTFQVTDVKRFVPQEETMYNLTGKPTKLPLLK